MSAEDSQLQIFTSQYQESFLLDRNQDGDINPQNLSGDENAEQSVYSTIQAKNKANFLLTTVTIIKTVIGAGILSLPFSVRELGYVLSLVVFVFVGLMTHFSAILLLNAKNLSGHSNYATILYHLFQGKGWKALGSILILLNNFGICIAEVILIKSTVRKVLEDLIEPGNEVLDSFYTQTYFIALMVLLCQIPFTLVKKIERLKVLAFLGVNGINLFIVSFIIHYTLVSLDENPANNPVGNMQLFPSDWFKAAAVIPNILLAISYQMNFFPVYKGMRDGNDKKYTCVSLSAIIFVLAAYTLVGILGYNLVGNGVSANFLQSLPYDKTNVFLFYIINGGIILSVFCSFPIMFFGCRNNFIAILQLIMTKQSGKDKKWRQNSDNQEQISSYIQSEDRIQKKKKAQLWFIVYTGILFLSIGVVAVLVSNIEAVFNIVGAVCSNSIGVLLPCLFYFMLVHKKKKSKGIKYYLTIVIFVVMLPYALFSIIAQKIS